MEKINVYDVNYCLKTVFILLFICCVFDSNGQTFQDVSISKGINTYAGFADAAVAVIDYDNDGWEDILFTSGYSSSNRGFTKLYKNINGLSFQDVTESSELDSLNQYRIYTIGVSVGDIDNDGDKDIIFSTFLGGDNFNGQPLLYENTGDGTFKELPNSFSSINFNWGEAVSFGDINADGYLDVYFSNYKRNLSIIYDTEGNETGYIPEGLPNHLYLNNKNKTFTNVSSLYNCLNNGTTYVSYFTDFDNDRDVDLLIGNDFGEWTGPFGVIPNALLKNNYPSIPFSDISETSNMNQGIYTMGIAAGDYDNDLDLDYYFTNIGKNYLMRQNANHTFTDVANESGVADSVDTPNGLRKTSWGCLFLDIDNDEDLDLYVNSGWFFLTLPLTTTFDSNRLFTNNGNGHFTDITGTSGIGSILSHRGCAQFDFNKDGKLDIVSAVSNIAFPSTPSETPHSFLYQNNSGTTNNYLNIQLQGLRCNRDGYGCKILIYYNNKHQMREVSGGGDPHCSISSSIQHFGLGNNTTVDSIQVFWLGGSVQTIKNVAANQTKTIIEDTTSSIVSTVFDFKLENKVQLFPTVVSNLSDIILRNNIPLKNIQIISTNGTIIFNNDRNLDTGIHSFSELLKPGSTYENGIYFIKITDRYNISTIQKILLIK